MGSVGSVEGKKQQREREIFAHPCSRRIEMEHNGLERRFVSFFRLSLGQPILPRATNFANFEKTQTWHDPHPSNQRDSFFKKKKKKREDRKAVEVSLERGKPRFDENCHPFRSFHHAFPSSSVIFFSRIEIKKSYRWFEHFPSPFRIFHVAASLFSVYSLEL